MITLVAKNRDKPYFIGHTIQELFNTIISNLAIGNFNFLILISGFLWYINAETDHSKYSDSLAKVTPE